MDYLEPPVIMTFDRDLDITEEVVQEFIMLHQAELPRYQELMNMYKGNMAIYKQKKKDAYKPDVRLSVGMPKYITDTFTGYFNGIPVKKSHPDKEISAKVELFDSTNDIEDVEHEEAKIACICGKVFELMYQDEETQTRVTYVSPENMFVVYDDTVEQNRLFAVRYSVDTEGNQNGTVYMLDKTYDFNTTEGNQQIHFTDEYENVFDELPVYEFYFNEERMGIFEGEKSLIDNYNKALSEKANDVEYFSDSYMKLFGYKLDEKSIENIRENRVINAHGQDSEKVVAEFMNKPDSDQATENYLNRVERLIFKTAMVADISDESFGSSASGTSLAYKLQAMSNLALSFQRKFESALRTRYSLFFSVETNFPQAQSGEWKSLEYLFNRNQPKNRKEEAETAVMMSTITSEFTALSEISSIQDVQAEMDRIAEERSKGIDSEPFNVQDNKVIEEGV